MVLELTEEQIIENSKIANYHCPRYEELPKMYVYMDQLLTILDEYLSPFDIESEDKNMTATMINSYVKKGIIPSPTNKKYSTVHIVYLIVLGTLKNVLSLSTIEKLIKMQKEQYPLERAYNFFAMEMENALKATFHSRDFSETNSERERTPLSMVVHSALLAFANNVYVRKNVCSVV